MKNYVNIRDAIFGEIYEIALKDKKTVVFTADAGALIFKKFQEDIPSQFYNVGIAEQNAMSAAAGLAFTGRRVFVNGIANFVTLRCLEQIKVDIALMNLPVTILASGTGYFYGADGPTHHMTDNLAAIRALPNLAIFSPSSCSSAAELVHQAYGMKGPNCIWFDGGVPANLGNEDKLNFSDGANLVKPGKDVMIVSTGVMVQEAIKIAEELNKSGVDAGVVDLYRLKPLNKEFILNLLKGVKRIAAVEEHAASGGLGGIICEFLAENNIVLPVKIFGIPDVLHCEIGDREYLRSLNKLDNPHIIESIKNWL